MQRSAALALTIIFFVLFAFLAYFGARVALWSSVIFGIFVSLIILNIFYPPSQATIDDPDYTLVLYASIEIIGIILLSIYIFRATLSDVRCC